MEEAFGLLSNWNCGHAFLWSELINILIMILVNYIKAHFAFKIIPNIL